MNKIKKLAEDFLAKNPNVFSADFEANKKALDQIAVIHNRTLRNQLAGAITVLAKETIGTKPSQESEARSLGEAAETVEENQTVTQEAQ